LIYDGYDSYITASWIAHYMENNIIFMVLLLHSSHVTQSLDVGVFSPLKTLMISVIKPFISTELHRILKAEWLSTFAEAHDKAFCFQNIQAGFWGTSIQLFNPNKVLDYIELVVENTTVVHSSMLIESMVLYRNSVLTSLPLYNDEVHMANAALLAALSSDGSISTLA